MSFLDGREVCVYAHSATLAMTISLIAGYVRVVIRAQDVASLRNVAVMQQMWTDDTVAPSGSPPPWLRDYAGGPAKAGAP